MIDIHVLAETRFLLTRESCFSKVQIYRDLSSTDSELPEFPGEGEEFFREVAVAAGVFVEIVLVHLFSAVEIAQWQKLHNGLTAQTLPDF